MDQKTKVVIIHGSYGSPEENWFPWLAAEVEKLGISSIVPKFPTPEGQSLDSWRNSFFQQINVIEENMVFVGHSLGPGFILKMLQETETQILGSFFVSAFLGELGLDDFDPINKTFVTGKFDWPKIRKNAGKIHIYNSDNDPYVPIEKGHEIAKNLGVELTIIEGGGHINAGAGYTTFPLLFEDIKKLLVP